MQKLITINLDNRLFQLHERAYDALRAYLEHAESQLGANPDRVEIIRDLEQSIAEKLMKPGEPPRAIVTVADVADVLREIGPVDAGAPGSGSAPPPGTLPGTTSMPQASLQGSRRRDDHRAVQRHRGARQHRSHVRQDSVRGCRHRRDRGVRSASCRRRRSLCDPRVHRAVRDPGTGRRPGDAPDRLMDKVRLKIERVRTALFGGVRHNAQ